MEIFRRYLTDIYVFLLLFGSFAYFQHSQPGWNVNSRFALTLALAETGSPVVDNYVSQRALETRDLARYKGHLYSDKSIGTSILGVPAVWVVKTMEAITDETFSTATRRYLVTLLSVGVSGALSGVLLMRLLSLLWSPPGSASGINVSGAAAFSAITVTLGSMLYLYGTLFMSYLPAHLFLVAAMLALETALLTSSREPASGGEERRQMRQPRRLFALAGLFGGLAALCEYTYAVAPAFMGLYLLVRLRGRRLKNQAAGRTNEQPVPGFSSAALYIIGGLIGIAPFLYYSYSVFGRFTIPYEYHLMPRFREAMAKGFMGATWPPGADVLWLITFHPFRGIFFYSPLLLLGTTGLIWMSIRDIPRHSIAWLCMACITFYLLFNSAYYMWWGGWSFSARHLAPAIPFMAAGLWPWFQHGAGRWLAGAAGLAGVAVHTMVNATEPQPPDGGWQTALLRPDLVAFDYPSVFMLHTWPRVVAGALDGNLGVMTGLRENLTTLLPLMLWWIILGVLISRRCVRSRLT